MRNSGGLSRVAPWKVILLLNAQIQMTTGLCTYENTVVPNVKYIFGLFQGGSGGNGEIWGGGQDVSTVLRKTTLKKLN